MQHNNDNANTIAVLALIFAILGFIIASVAPMIGPLTGLILVAFISGGAAFVWADRRLQRRNK